MKTVIDKAASRGHANQGWLKSHHTFSFSNYYNPQRIHFGALRVLNDDWIAPGKGFGMHPHDNMEIITIPLAGVVEHKDNMGNTGTITAGEVQVMSAGTGILHSETNGSADNALELLQIWVIPDKKHVAPRYEQITLKPLEKKNELYQILSPNAHEPGVWIHQQAWFYLGNFDQNWEGMYHLHRPESGIYVFVIEGNASVMNQELNRRDGMGCSEISEVNLAATAGTRMLIMEVPVKL